ncbi:MAG: (2Fe-2S)-binding protein [Microscillaceae bacterium]|nr:(2Fe-2S)-binding protein [Microscillaceae bacterium]MDW8459975.1 2Fe-2S iron-sulfur cluster-binding protein [Cytophagales bacterium]
MPTIKIQNLANISIQVVENQTILACLQQHSIDWMQACGGKGRCTTCKMVILEGQTLLAPLTEAELRFIAQGKLKEQERLACQCKIIQEGEVKVVVPKQYQLPHLTYTEE